MLISDYLFNESKDIWQSYLKHPFLVKMGENTLDKEKFRKYLIQDFLYLKEYAKVYAMGLIKSDKMENIKFFKESIVGILEDESATHIEYLKDFGEKIDELDKYSINFDNETYLKSVRKVSKLPIDKIISYHGGMLEGTISAGIKSLIS